VYLKSLTLHGFKTFAQRTQLSFEPGITAIVGPNGSGKSNCADALRWVLGEQSLRSLRGRRTEDVLFAGGSGRPPSGMAEVTLTFDNSRRWLDIPYSEVTIARRAYRSGENEYYLNRDRVRLRDVADLLGRISLSADGFAIVGQGTVDAALSLRPEDRRALIEQAAAIGHLYVRLDDARGRLTQSQHNLQRVSDLIAEISPRLRVLERQARQAKERQAVRAEFFRGLIRWYGHLWSLPRGRHDQALRDAQSARANAQSAAQALAHAEAQLRAARTLRTRVDRDAKEATEELDRRRSARSTLDHAAAMDRERRESLRQRLEEYQTFANQQKNEVERERSLVGDLTAERSALVAQVRQADAELAAAEEAAATWRSHRAALERALQEAHRGHTHAESQRAAAVARRRATLDRLDQIEPSLTEAAARIDGLEAILATAGHRVDECRSSLAELRQEGERLATERRAAADRLQRCQGELDGEAARLAAVDRELHALRARCDALQHVEEAGTGYFSGVRAVLQAANGHGTVHLNGIVGVVAKLVEVSSDVELAIETALGSHLQDVVVTRWADAEAAIAHLKKSGAGRATFLPLDTLRPNRPSVAPSGPGLLGVASSLVRVEARFRVVGEFLLGQTLVVEDLAVARRILSDCPPIWQIVTLEGELTRSSGTVTGGTPGPSRGTLARHRELRDGREAIAGRERERDGIVAALSSSRLAASDASARVAGLVKEERALEDRVRHATADLVEAQQRHDQASHALTTKRDERQRFVQQQCTAREALADLDQALAQTERDSSAAAQRLEAVQQEWAALEQEAGESSGSIAASRSACDTLHERLKAAETALAHAEARCRHLESRIDAQVKRADEISSALQKLDLGVETRLVEARTHASAIALAEARLATVQEARQTAESHERTAEADHLQAQAAEREAAERLRDSERRVELANAEIDGIRQQVLLDIGPLDDDAPRGDVLSANLPDGVTLSSPIAALAEPERWRSRLDSLRSRLRTMPVSLDAVTEYEATRERSDYLTAQTADLGRTTATLRDAIEETRSSMKSRFDQTFANVAAGFSRRFVELFGGGSARLVVAGDDDGAGIEVIAQPPGKRAESLAMLSGGERALTAAALLFALIEANPPPFCALDEIDAALDESNVGRFCSALRSLSARTQFIVITHNRRTMEAASTIYGLAVENRCESRVLAMRLPTA